VNAHKLKEVIHYNPETGVFTWLVSTACRIKVGDVAGAVGNGYRRIKIEGVLYQAAHLAHLYMTGDLPINCMDHIDHDRSNNRWNNLRQATCKENSMNMSKSRRNTSGYTGIYWEKSRNKWKALIRANNQIHHLGYFLDKIEAYKARKKAEIKYGFHQNHGQ